MCTKYFPPKQQPKTGPLSNRLLLHRGSRVCQAQVGENAAALQHENQARHKPRSAPLRWLPRSQLDTQARGRSRRQLLPKRLSTSNVSALTSTQVAALFSARAAASRAAESRLSRPLASADLASASCCAAFLASRSCGTATRQKMVTKMWGQTE